MTISVAAGESTDAAGNSDAGAGPSATVTVDNTAPTVSIGTPSSTLVNSSGSTNITIAYEVTPSPSITASDITVNTASGNATCTDSVNNADPQNPVVTLSSCSGNGTVTISVAAAQSQDAAGNFDTGAGPSDTITVDNTAPTVSIGTPTDSPINSSGSTAFTVTYTGATSVNLAAGEVTLSTTGGVACSTKTVSNGTSNTPTVNLSGCTGTGTVRINVTAGQATDAAGNTDTGAGPSASVTVDNSPPIVYVDAPSPGTGDSSTTYLFGVHYTDADSIHLAANEVSLNTTGSVSCSTKTVSLGSTADPLVYVSGCTGSGTVGITVTAGQASDAAGNTAAGTTSSTADVINVPTVTFSSVGQTLLGPGDTVSFTLSLDYAKPGGLLTGDITFNGTSSGCSVSGISSALTTSPVVSVSGCLATSGTMSIDVYDQGPSQTVTLAKAPMISTWRTTTSNETITLPLRSGYTYNATVFWEYGTSSSITAWNDADITHNYSSAGDYTVKIYGTAEAWYFNGGGDKEKFISVSQLGDLGWKDLTNAFFGCSYLTEFTAGNTDTSAVTNMYGMFRFYVSPDSALTSVDLSSFDTSSVTDMANMFNHAKSLTALDVTNFNTSNVTDMNSMFRSLESLTSLNLTNFNTSNVTSMWAMFRDSWFLTALDLSSFNTSSVLYMNQMFDGTPSLTSLDISSFDTSNINTMMGMFRGTGLTSLNLSHFNTSSVTDMAEMFYSTDFTSLNLSSFNTSSVTSMKQMFASSLALESVDLSSFNTSMVSDMNQMFYDTALTALDLSSFDTSNVTTMYGTYMKLDMATLDLSGLDTSSVTDMTGAFMMSNITTLNLTGFVTSTVDNMTNMFYMANIPTVDCTNCDTTNASLFYDGWTTMFTGTIYCNDPDNGGGGAPGAGTINGRNCQ
jgi:surface protein